MSSSWAVARLPIVVLAGALGAGCVCGEPTTSAAPPEPELATSTEPATEPPAANEALPRAPDREQARGEVIDVPSEGDCMRLASARISTLRRVLGDRLRVDVTEDAEVRGGRHDIMSAPPSAQGLEVVELRAEADAAISIYIEESFRSAPRDLLTAVRAIVPEGWDVGEIETRGAGRAVVTTPVPLREREGFVELLRTYMTGADGLVLQSAFFAPVDMVRAGGRTEAARRVASTFSHGSRVIDAAGGERVLSRDIGLTLPAGFALVTDDGPDFSVFRVHAVEPFDELGGSLGVYEGGHASFDPPPSATTHSTRTFDRDVVWYEYEQDGQHRGDGLIDLDHGVLHVFYGSASPSVFASLRAVAESLHRVVPVAHASVCSGDLPALPPVGRVASTDVSLLRVAERFALVSSALGDPQVAEAAAFRHLLASDDAIAGFLDLIAHGTTAGRVYGLAGLRELAPERFAELACAVRPVLESPVRVQDGCSETLRDPWQLVERTDPSAIRGESHWGEYAWSYALAHGELDLVGGSLSRVLAFGDPGDRDLEEAAWIAGPAGIAGLQPTPIAPLPPSRPGAGAARLFPQEYGFCATRDDGRVSCWGDVYTGTSAVDLPDVVRSPLDVRRGLLGCMLDAEGRRTCWTDPRGDRENVRQRCSVSIESGPIVRRHDDGRWRSLLRLQGQTCGVRSDNTLWCFAIDRDDVPDWTTQTASRPGDAWRVLGEAVAGAVDGYLAAYAWTDDGRIFEITDRESPRLIGSLHGLARIAAGIDGPIFAELRDGRVFAWAMRADFNDRPTYWSRGGPALERWVEVPELRGARIEATDYHACARFPEGRVSCWGANRDGELGPSGEWQVGPRDVPAISAARQLFLQPQTTCALISEDTIRCMGLRAPDVSLERVAPGERGPLDISLPH